MLVTAYEVLKTCQDPTREEIRNALSGNYYRCTGYEAIVDAIQRAAGIWANQTAAAQVEPGLSNDAEEILHSPHSIGPTPRINVASAVSPLRARTKSVDITVASSRQGRLLPLSGGNSMSHMQAEETLGPEQWSSAPLHDRARRWSGAKPRSTVRAVTLNSKRRPQTGGDPAKVIGDL